MIRIFTTNEPGAIKLTVDGQLTADGLTAVETSIDQAIGQQRPVHLFLRNVSNIDEQGRTLLSRAAAKGVALSASGVYSSYVVAEILQQPPSAAHGQPPAIMPRKWHFAAARDGAQPQRRDETNQPTPRNQAPFQSTDESRRFTSALFSACAEILAA